MPILSPGYRAWAGVELRLEAHPVAWNCSEAVRKRYRR